MYDERTIFAFIALLGFFALILFIFGIIFYILGAVGLYKLAYNRRIENPWLAFIPIANLYIFGLIIKELKIDSFEIPSLELVLPLGCIAVTIIRHIPLIGWLADIAYLLIVLFSLHKLYSIYRPRLAALWLVLSIILPFMGPIFIFVIRNDNPAVS